VLQEISPVNIFYHKALPTPTSSFGCCRLIIDPDSSAIHDNLAMVHDRRGDLA
jgi:hypothetical protein